ncbi:ABC transporter permease [Nocardioides sp. L-11A]|uniref:ABC transporter permease n=1 Tax=Nocardioides sp. L-11A TaxID=3043848 RepID=UPI00249C1F95|nr:ABC transporter permease [Nocardioides sp. L-11A]
MADLTVPSASVAPPAPGGRRGVVARRFVAHRVALTSLVLLVLLVAAVVVGPMLWRYDHTVITPDTLAPPSSRHPFGTDPVGHDMLALVMRGAQRSLAVAIIVAVLSTLLGTLVGMVAGYFGGLVDNILMRGVDLVLMMPLLAVLGLVAVRVGGTDSGWLIVAVAISLLYWTPTARVIRTQVQTLRHSDFVESARLVGASTPRILGRHLLPHLVGPIAVVTTTYVAAAIALESTLSFLGLGVQPPDTSLGLLVGDGVGFASTAWWLFYLPGAFIVVIVLLIHLIGDGLQAAFNRSSKAAH